MTSAGSHALGSGRNVLAPAPGLEVLEDHHGPRVGREEVLGRHYLSDATLSNPASFALFVFRHVKDHRNSLQSSPLLKKACARQVVLDRWFP